jgi:all-trans-retinol 13,14-reductase
MDSGNVWFSRTTDVDASYAYAERETLTGREPVPGIFCNATTLKDPTMRSDGIHIVEAMAISSVDPFARWRDLPPGKRGAEYRQLKDDLTERVLDAVECFVPGLRERTVFRALGTPLTNVRFLNATRGGIYGTEKRRRRSAAHRTICSRRPGRNCASTPPRIRRRGRARRDRHRRAPDAPERPTW